MLATELPMVTDVNLGHDRNAVCPRLVTELGMVIDVNPDELNALSPILLTSEVEVNVTDDKLVQLMNV